MTCSVPLFRLAALAALTGLGACSKKNDPAAPAVPVSKVSWTVDGNTESATYFTGEITAGGMLGFRAATGDNFVNRRNSVELHMPGRTGTFMVAGTGGGTATYHVYDFPGNSALYPGNGGTITVSSYSASTALGASHMVGTFTFTARQNTAPNDSKTITAGSFDVYF